MNSWRHHMVNFPMMMRNVFDTMPALDYILPGKFENDPIERCFGQFRQYFGGQFAISLTQCNQAMKKQRVIHLLHLGLSSGTELEDVKEHDTPSQTEKTFTVVKSLIYVEHKVRYLEILLI